MLTSILYDQAKLTETSVFPALIITGAHHCFSVYLCIGGPVCTYAFTDVDNG